MSGSRRIASALASALGREVRVAYRYGRPSIAEMLEDRPLVIPLFPQRTGSTTGTIEALVGDRATVSVPAADAPGYIEAQAELFRESVGNDPPEHFLVSFHGIPVRYDRSEGGLYRRDCEATYEALLDRLGWPRGRATLTYQSRFGPEPWIGLSTAKALQKLARAGIRSLAVATPGFVTEGLETAEEIGLRGKRTFVEAGGERFVRVPCVEAHPAFIRALAELVRRPS